MVDEDVNCWACLDTGFIFVPDERFPGSLITEACPCDVAYHPKGWTRTMRVYCCRGWDVLPGGRWGACGYCGCRPVPLESKRRK